MAGSFGFGTSSSSQRSDPRDVTPPEFRALRPGFSDVLNRLFGVNTGDPLKGIPSYSGPLTAPMAAGEGQILDQLLARGGGAGSDLLGRTAAGDFVSTTLDPFTKAAIDASIAPFQRQQDEFLRRQLPSAAIQAGQSPTPGGSAALSRFGMIESADIAQRAAETGAGLAFQQHEAERGRQQEAIQLGQQEVQTLTQNLQAQALPRLIQELGIERGLTEFQNRMQSLLQALAVVAGSPISQVAQQSRGDSSSFNIESAGGVGYTSDARLKTDIEVLTELAPGIHLYSFRWRDSGAQNIGLLAQEVELSHPELVHRTANGLRMVDYGGVNALAV